MEFSRPNTYAIGNAIKIHSISIAVTPTCPVTLTINGRVYR